MQRFHTFQNKIRTPLRKNAPASLISPSPQPSTPTHPNLQKESESFAPHTFSPGDPRSPPLEGIPFQWPSMARQTLHPRGARRVRPAIGGGGSREPGAGSQEQVVFRALNPCERRRSLHEARDPGIVLLTRERAAPQRFVALGLCFWPKVARALPKTGGCWGPKQGRSLELLEGSVKPAKKTLNLLASVTSIQQLSRAAASLSGAAGGLAASYRSTQKTCRHRAENKGGTGSEGDKLISHESGGPVSGFSSFLVSKQSILEGSSKSD